MAGVRTTHSDYDRLSTRWQKCRDAIAGQYAMHQAGERYLRKNKNEEAEDYKTRLLNSDYWNATWRTIDALSAMAFRKPPTVKVPTGIEKYLEDVTLSGIPMQAFAQEVTEEVLSVGRVGILVDHPPQQLDEQGKVVPITQAAAQERGLRPTLQLYTAESIRNWKFQRINNNWMLSMVVLGENEAVAKDEFTDEVEARYRVLDLGGPGGCYRVRVFKVEDEKDVLLSEHIPVMNGKPLDRIPFIIVGASGRNDCIDEPPLIDLVDHNVSHYRVNSVLQHTLMFTPPVFFISGYTAAEGEKISIGGTSALIFPDPNAKADYAEPKGNNIPQLRIDLQEKKQEMAMSGARMIADETAQAETLGATQIKRTGENSVLSKVVQGISEALKWALDLFSEWAGQKADTTYDLNRDFMPVMMDAQSLTALFAGVQSGNVSKQEAFLLLQRGDVIDGDVSYEEHQTQIEADGPPAPAMPKPGQQPGAAAA